MNSAPWSARLPRMSPARAFGTVFSAVFLFIFGSSAVVTFVLPQSYSAKARVVAPGPGNLELFQSPELLKTVSQHLNLSRILAARYGENKPLDQQRVEDLLRRSLQVRRLNGTDLIEIKVHGPSPEECAQLANEIAATAAKQPGNGAGTIQVVDKALPPPAPSRPNKPLNLVLGAVVGVFLGIMAGGVGAKLAVGFDAQKPPNP